jgi:chemotaxis regulatin CheY-phosphate phosphatase CheZ
MSENESLQLRIQNEVADLSRALTGLIENFQKLRSPLVESHEKVPQATSQLDKISAQTEAAAGRMLDTVEQITQRDQEIIDGLKAVMSNSSSSIKDCMPTLNAITEKANTNLNDAYAIMDALQFQDITSQQMDHAASLLEEIEGKLHSILSIVGFDALGDAPDSVKKKVRAYDPHADMFEKKTDQQAIDSIFQRTKS